MDETFLESYPGAIGIKTGYTDRAGDCLMAAATRGGRTMLAVVMNGYNPTATAIDLLNEGFATPASREPAADRLPPPALPSAQKAVAPPARAAKFAAPHATTPVRSVPEHASATNRPSFERTVSLRGSTAAATAVAHVQRRQGLAAVASTWLGKVLLIATGISAVWALIELLAETNLRRRRRQTMGSFTSAGSLLSNLHGGKRRREQLLASYRRHERTSSRYGK